MVMDGKPVDGLDIADLAWMEGKVEVDCPYFLSCPLPRKHNYHGGFRMLHMS